MMMLMMMMMMMMYVQGKATIDLPSKDKHTAMMSGLITCKASVTELLIQHGLSEITLYVRLSVCLCVSPCIHRYITYTHTYIHKTCSAPFTIKTTPITVHFSVNRE